MPLLVLLIDSLRFRARRKEDGFAIAEALAYTALAIVLLVFIFGLWRGVASDVVAKVREEIGL